MHLRPGRRQALAPCTAPKYALGSFRFDRHHRLLSLTLPSVDFILSVGRGLSVIRPQRGWDD